MILKFGQYKGVHIINVPDDYLLWLHGRDIKDAELRKYLDDNIKAIEANVERNKKLRPRHF